LNRSDFQVRDKQLSCNHGRFVVIIVLRILINMTLCRRTLPEFIIVLAVPSAMSICLYPLLHLLLLCKFYKKSENAFLANKILKCSYLFFPCSCGKTL